MSNINPVTEASVEATPLPPQPAVTNPVGTAAPILPVEDKPLNLGGHEFQSRFILGSGRYDLNLIKATVEHAGTQIVTMALRRAQTTENSVLDYIPEGITLLPNTSGARNAEEAVRIARLAREVCHTDFVKVEIEHETKYLLPDNAETIRATEMLANEGHGDPGEGGLRGHALHVPGPDCGPSAGGGRCRCRYAARFVDRLQYGPAHA